MVEFGADDTGVDTAAFVTWLDVLDREGDAGFVFRGIGARFDSGGTVRVANPAGPAVFVLS